MFDYPADTFMDLYSQGHALPDEIDDFIDNWHNSLPTETRELYVYLGMSFDEYAVFVSDPSVLPLILKARIERDSLENVIAFRLADLNVAARGQDEATLQALRNWLLQRKSTE